MNKKEFIDKCNKARQLQIELDRTLQEIISNIDSDSLIKETNAENADNVEESIFCFAHYGEYSPEEIWEEINSQQSEEI